MNGKKILSLLLCMLMMVSLFPVSAFADETAAETQPPKEITWILNEGTLTVSGEAAMKDYASADEQPWKAERAGIKNVVIEKGVTAVGSFAFAECTALETVTIADTVTTIGKSAFANTAVKSVTIPFGITEIGEKAFEGCSKLETVNVPCDWDERSIPESESGTEPAPEGGNESETQPEVKKPLYTFAETVKLEKSVHDLSYTAEGGKITETCSGCDREFTLELIAPESLVYDGNEKAVKLENKIPGVEDPEIKYEGDRVNVTAEGFTASVTIKPDEEELTASLSLNITPMAAVITEPTASEIGFGQPLSDSVLSDSSWSWLDGTQIPAVGENTYPAVTKADDANYDYSNLTGYTAETGTITRGIMVKVGKAAGSCAVTIADWNYGEAASTPVPYSDTNGTDNVTYAYKVKGADDGTYSEAVPTEVGEYTLKATFAATADYAEVSATADFKILSVAPTAIDISTASVTVSGDYSYTGSPICPAADKLSLSLNGQTVDISGFTLEYSNNVNAGEATVSITAPEGSAYSGSASGKFTIDRAVATITNVTLREKHYDGTPAVQIDTMTAGGFDSSDNVNIDTSGITAALPGSEVGSYSSVTISGLKLSGDNKDNFTISESISISGSFSILPGSLTPVIELSADSFTYNGKEQKPGVTLKQGSTVIPASEYTLSFTDSVKAGTVTVTVTDAEGGSYSFDTVTRTYTIKPAKLTVAPRAVSVTRGATAPNLGYAVTGIISGEKISANTALQFKLYTSSGAEISPAEAVKTAGTYTIKWVNMNSIVFSNVENYELSKVETASFLVTAPANNAVVTTPTPTAKPSATARPSATMKPATTMQPVSTAKPAVTVPITGDFKSISAEVSVSGNSASLDKVDMNKLGDVMGGLVSVDFSKLSAGTGLTSVELPATVVKEIAQAAAQPGSVEAFVIVLSDDISVEFDSQALGQKSAQAKGRDITLSLKRSDSVSTLSDAQKKAVSGHDAYDVKLSSGGQYISQLGGKVSISVPYELKDGETAENIRVWYVDPDGRREACESSYDIVNRRVTWQTDHLSLFMIDHEDPITLPGEQIENSVPGTPAPTVVEGETGSDLGAFLWIMLIALILMGVGGLVFFILRRRKEY